MAIPTPIRKWIEQFTSARGFFQSSSEVDHDATSNRTHSGDDLSPATLDADTLIGADVVNAAENQILVTQGDGTLAAETQAQGPNPYDQAQTFTESDVTVSHNDTDAINGSIQIRSVFPLPDDNNSGSIPDGRGLVVNPNESLNGLRVTLSKNMGSVQDVFIADSSETILDEVTAGYSAGETVELTASLSASTDYYVGVYNDGANYTVGYNDSPLFDYESSAFDVTNGATGIHPNDGNTANTVNNKYAFASIGSKSQPNSGNAIIEWDRGIPTDIFEWDVATFTRTLDNETVDVFVAYSSDGGSTWQRTNSGNPITRNYSLNEDTNITPDVDVRIETELNRSDPANNPTLDSAYRSWLV